MTCDEAATLCTRCSTASSMPGTRARSKLMWRPARAAPHGSRDYRAHADRDGRGPAARTRRPRACGGGSTLPSPRAARRAAGACCRGLRSGQRFSAAAAASVARIRDAPEDDQRMLGDVVSAHLRSLQAEHLTDVLSTDQHTVKPWFNGRIDIAPPVVDLTAQGFTLLGGRLDYIDGKPVAAIVYRRRKHIINLFVMQSARSAARKSKRCRDLMSGAGPRARFLGHQRHQCRGAAGIRRKFQTLLRTSGG